MSRPAGRAAFSVPFVISLTAAEAAARRAVERLPGAVGVRIQWRGPLAGVEPPPLVSLHAIGSVAPAMGSALRALAELAQAMVRDALQDLARRHR